MSVTDYLEQARDCAALANRRTGDEKQRLLEIVNAWLKLGEQEAEALSTAFGKLPAPPKSEIASKR